MSFSLDRRRFPGTALAGAAIVAFDPLRSGWVTAAEAAEGVGSVPFNPLDWVAQYGRDYPAFAAAKATFDPRRVLAPGQGIFGPQR